MQVVYTQPCDVGWGCLNRRRAFTVFVRRDVAEFLCDPQDNYDLLCEELQNSSLRIPDLFWGDKTMFDEEVSTFVNGSRCRTKSKPLTKSEYENRRNYEKLLDTTRPEEDKFHQLFCLNQAPDKVCKVSRKGVIPTLTRTDKIMWNRGKKRWMLASEKFTAHGYPMTDELSKILKIPALWLQVLSHLWVW